MFQGYIGRFLDISLLPQQFNNKVISLGVRSTFGGNFAHEVFLQKKICIGGSSSRHPIKRGISPPKIHPRKSTCPQKGNHIFQPLRFSGNMLVFKGVCWANCP